MVCKYEFRHVNGLVRHRTQVHELKKGSVHAAVRRRAARRELVPDGLGYLIKLFASPARSGLGTQELTKFAQYLQELLHTKIKSRTRRIYNKAKLEGLKEDPDGHSSTGLILPNRYLIPAYQIAEVSGVQPSEVLTALIAYGLEYLAKELRQYPVIPQVKKPPDVPKKETKNDLPPSNPVARPRFL
jgi:hypothetical protein